MPCKIHWIALKVVCELLLPFRPRALNWEQLHFVVCDQKSKMVNSNVPHLHSLVSVCCIESIFQVKLLIVFSSIKQTYDGSVVSIVRMEWLQTRSFELLQLWRWDHTASIHFEQWLEQFFRKNQTHTTFKSPSLVKIFMRSHRDLATISARSRRVFWPPRFPHLAAISAPRRDHGRDRGVILTWDRSKITVS